MISETGHFALIMALIVAAVQACVPLIGAWTGNVRRMAVAGSAASLQFLLVAAAFAALIYAFTVSDFSLKVVALNSHSAKPMLYKVTGTWGNHEGSMLLWVLILSLFGACVALFAGTMTRAAKALVLAVQGMIGAAFLAFILFTSNPFERLAAPPLDGRGLNPLLQDPGLAIHPPFLYLGYVGFSIVFAFAVAALLEGRFDAVWARWMRPWALAAWSCLTAGIALGSGWAYYELGWGGWWFWDPVENASFMPWLVGTALIHSLAVVEKRDALKRWTLLLAIITFALSLIGTFLVRSGILTSVHAFAQDPERGVFILLIIGLMVGGAFSLYGLRVTKLRGGGEFAILSRETGLVFNNMMLSIAAATVLIGTLYPVGLDVVTGQKISVGAPYFNATFVPIMIPAILVMAAGPLLPWKRSSLGDLLRRLRFAAAAALACGALTLFWKGGGEIAGALAMALAGWLAGGTLYALAERVALFRGPLGSSLRRLGGLPAGQWGMTLGHLGLAVAVAGITAVSLWKVERIQAQKPGETVAVAGYDLTLVDIRQVTGTNYQSEIAAIRVKRGDNLVAVLFPEKRRYPAEGNETSEVAIHTTGLADLYAVIGDPADGGARVTRLYYNPGIPLIWYGALLMALGGAISIGGRRVRKAQISRAQAALDRLQSRAPEPQAGA